MLRKRTRYRIFCALFVAALIGIAFFGSYSGSHSQSAPATRVALDTDEPVIVAGMRLHDVVLGVFTLALVVVGVFQFCQMKRTNDYNARLERAYVFAKVKIGNGIVATHSGTAPSTFMVHFPNRGKTPAILIRMRGYVVIEKTAPTQLMTFPGSEQEIAPGLVIKADGMFDMPVQTRITNAELGEIERLEKTLFCVGLVEYWDVLGRRQKTGFCWQYRHSDSGAGRFQITPDSKLNYYT